MHWQFKYNTLWLSSKLKTQKYGQLENLFLAFFGEKFYHLSKLSISYKH